MRTYSSLHALTVALAATTYGHGVLAEPVTLNFDDPSELTSAGFANVEGGGTTTVSDGIATIVGDTFEEWKLDAAVGTWFVPTLRDGWVVEGRVRIVDADPDCASTGMWISGDSSLVHFQLSSTWAGINYPSRHRVEMDTTDDFHTYRVQYVGYHRYLIIIDGELVADVHQVMGGGGTPALMFGDLGGCSGATSEWDWFQYDPVSYPIPEGDADADGIDNTTDNCATDANGDQADADGDRDGDVCDRCPNDPMNDADGDEICGDIDPCPEEARNDQDEDGTCDTEQCAPWETAIALCSHPNCEIPADCPAVCNCERPFFGVDPFPDQFAPLPPTPTGSVVMLGPSMPDPTTPGASTPVEGEPAPSTDVDEPVENGPNPGDPTPVQDGSNGPNSSPNGAGGAFSDPGTETDTSGESTSSSDPTTASNSSSGCALTTERGTHSPTALAWLALAASVLVSRRRRGTAQRA